MNRSELEGWVAERAGLGSTATRESLDAAFVVIAEALVGGEDARISGFRVFRTKVRPARTGRNPWTGESMSIAASTAPTLKPGKALNDAVNIETRD